MEISNDDMTTDMASDSAECLPDMKYKKESRTSSISSVSSPSILVKMEVSDIEATSHAASSPYHNLKAEREEIGTLPAAKKAMKKQKQKKTKKKKGKSSPLVPPNVHLEQGKWLNWFLPRMMNSEQYAPVPLPNGLASPESQDIIRDAGVDIWTAMEGFIFEDLPFLDHQETTHLACCIGLFPVPLKGITNMFFLLTRLYCHMARRIGSFCTAEPGRTDWYASVRQEVYNGCLASPVKRGHVELFRQSALGFAALEVSVMIKVLEACTQARQNFLRLHPGPAKAWQLEIIDSMEGPDPGTQDTSPILQSPMSNATAGDDLHILDDDNSPDIIKSDVGDHQDTVMIKKEPTHKTSDFGDDGLKQGALGTQQEGMDPPNGTTTEFSKLEEDVGMADEYENHDGRMKNEDDEDLIGGCEGDDNPVVTADFSKSVPRLPSHHPVGKQSGLLLGKLQRMLDDYNWCMEKTEIQTKILDWSQVFGNLNGMAGDGSAKSSLWIKQEI